MLQFAEQTSSPDRVWLGEFDPTLKGLKLSAPEWIATIAGQDYAVPAFEVKLSVDSENDQVIRLWLTPVEADGFLHLDVYPDDGEHDYAPPTPWPVHGCIQLLWGRLVAGSKEPELTAIKHVMEV